jgi:hypothetical protein
MSLQLSSFPALPVKQSDAPLSQRGQDLHRTLVKLSRRTQQVFLLSRLDNLPYATIASLLGIAVESVEQAMVRALHQCSRDALGTTVVAECVSEQAIRWYVHLQSPHATASQRIEFRHWLDADPAHLTGFEATERLWRQLQAPASVLGASGWYRRKRRGYILWCAATAFLCAVFMTAEAFASLL